MRTGLQGRTALVTGGAGGIGLATTRALLEEGCRVLACDLDHSALADLRSEHPGAMGFRRCDVSVLSDAENAVTAAVETFGGLDVLVACAGIYETSELRALDPESWDHVQGVNLRGTFLCARAALAVMGAAGWGRIITLGSVAAATGGIAAGAGYVSSKAGILGLTRSLAQHAGPLGVTVNCVCPGIIDTAMTRAMDRSTRRAAIESTPLRRAGTPEDVAAVIVMLVSEGAGFVTGAHLDVNGGLMMT